MYVIYTLYIHNVEYKWRSIEYTAIPEIVGNSALIPSQIFFKDFFKKSDSSQQLPQQF